MQNLLAFLAKYKNIFLFIILETIALLMVSYSYSYHGSLAFNSVNDITGGVFKTFAEVEDYFSLKQENEILLNENSRLHDSLESSFLITDTNYVYIDTLYRYIPAHVVYITVKNPSNYFIIDKGKKHGIKKEMGVISPTGIAGIVIGVSNHYSLVMPLIHPNFTGSAKIKKNNMLISVHWDTTDYRFGKITDIPSYVDLFKGDTIVTTGFSLIFPKDLIIGTVEKYYPSPEKEFATGIIRFSTDYKSLKNVYIIDNLMKPEIKKLLEDKDE